ncbi:hypothetical protein ACOSP7_012695 [Xanthoceras sorbifolium]
MSLKDRRPTEANLTKSSKSPRSRGAKNRLDRLDLQFARFANSTIAIPRFGEKKTNLSLFQNKRQREKSRLIRYSKTMLLA